MIVTLADLPRLTQAIFAPNTHLDVSRGVAEITDPVYPTWPEELPWNILTKLKRQMTLSGCTRVIFEPPFLAAPAYSGELVGVEVCTHHVAFRAIDLGVFAGRGVFALKFNTMADQETFARMLAERRDAE